MRQKRRYDAIVVGSGITGGWAAKELTEHGLDTLVLEAGRPIDPSKDYVEHVPDVSSALPRTAATARRSSAISRCRSALLRLRRVERQVLRERSRESVHDA